MAVVQDYEPDEKKRPRTRQEQWSWQRLEDSGRGLLGVQDRYTAVCRRNGTSAVASCGGGISWATAFLLYRQKAQANFKSRILLNNLWSGALQQYPPLPLQTCGTVYLLARWSCHLTLVQTKRVAWFRSWSVTQVNDEHVRYARQT